MSSFFQQLQTLNDRKGPIPGSLLNTLCLCGVLATGYFLLGRMAFAMAVSEGSATSVAFLPEGLALAFAILFGPRIGPGIFLGQFALSWSLGVIPAVGAAFGLVNMVEDLAGGYLFWRLGISPRMSRPRDVALLFGMSALLLQPLAAAAKAIPRLAISSPDTIFHLSLYSWAGNTMGQTLLTPILIAWCSYGFRVDFGQLRRALLIVLGFFLVLLAFKVSRLGEVDPLYWLLIFSAYYLTLIWVATRSTVQMTATSNLLITLGLLWVITSSPDSLLYFSTQNRVFYADILILGGVVTALLVSAFFGELDERTSQLHVSNAAKEQLFTVIGHDLRSPIATVKTTLDLMNQGHINQDEFRVFQADLTSGIDHAYRTLENLMEWGESQLHAVEANAVPVEVAATATEAIQLLQLQINNKRIVITNLIPTSARVLADSNHLASIFRNLLSNAIKFTPEDGRITLSANQAGKAWRLAITDTGVGMSTEQVARLLKPQGTLFSTLGTSNERGLGIGLRITQDFIAANHGKLSIESLPGKGSTFSIHLPQA